MNTDTIAAIATSLNESSIGIIRISGSDSISIADTIFINKNKEHKLHSYKSHTIHYGYIIDGENIIDEVMISIMKAPNSYTREDVVEINCHGGIRVCKSILDVVLNSGAIMAEPGEFTKRAFLNGRLDLTQAEAVMDVIRSESDLALNNSINQLRGTLNSQLNNICSSILYQIAFIESALDDPDSISLEGYSEKLTSICNETILLLDKLIRSYDEGRILSEGINTVILGKPNAGKSSLLNILLNEERAIVTNIPGTTRDTLTEKIRLGDVILHVTDTAGIRNTTDPIELIGVEKARQAIDTSDLILYIVDSSYPIDEDDIEIIKSIKEKNVIVLLNKSDLNQITTKKDINIKFEEYSVLVKSIISTSVKNNHGIDQLKDIIREMFYSDEIKKNDQIIITNLRHVDLLKKAKCSLQKVIKSIEDEMSEDFLTIDLTDAYTFLSTITGREVTEDIVNEIFSKFCMGK